MPDIWTKPRGIYLRTWPLQRYERSFQAMLRWQESDGPRQERRVHVAKRHGEIPLNPLQYRMWDELRTDIAMGDRDGDAVWAGVAKWPNDEWCQDHAVFCVMHEHYIQDVISVHFDRWIIGGRCAQDQRYDYIDWTFNSRRMIDLQHG